MPDRIEVASSGRARCRACRRPIAKGQERFAEAIPNPVAAGESQHYYHLECAAERRPKAFSELLPTLDPPRPDLAALNAAAVLTVEHHRLERLGALERAKSARANCRQCREPIEKDAWRVALQPLEEGRLGAWGFVHLTCAGAYAGIKPGLERLTRYTDLQPSERDEVALALDTMPTPEPRTDEDDRDETRAHPSDVGEGS
jgi:Poly(ADP-ribose) polymerase and DNA-Ligase Zn-finger region